MMIKKIINYIKEADFKIIYFNNSINVNNYDEILDVSDTIIKIKKDQKVVYIKGQNLQICKLMNKEVLINGKINTIEM